MELSDGLREVLKDRLKWNKCRLDCFIGMLLALLTLRQVNLTQLATAFAGPALKESRYRRLQRFFRDVVFDYDVIAHLIFDLFGFHNQLFYLTLDRTNWKWGKKDLNILTLAVVYKGAAIPIYWVILNKQGNSNQRERIALLQRFIRQFGRDRLAGVLGDREFIGCLWWQWLNEQGIPYLIRMKENQLMHDGKGRGYPVRRLFADLCVGQSRQCKKRYRISGQWVWLSALRLKNQEWLILASNQRFSKPLETYRLRWEIENLFQCLKGRGFHLEDTRLTGYFRIKKMMALVALAFCWAHKTGEWKQAAIKPLKIKTHGRLEKSIFRYGLDHLMEGLIHGIRKLKDTFLWLVIFICPPTMLETDPQNIDRIILRV